jgi:hypothetical protein
MLVSKCINYTRRNVSHASKINPINNINYNTAL